MWVTALLFHPKKSSADLITPLLPGTMLDSLHSENNAHVDHLVTNTFVTPTADDRDQLLTWLLLKTLSCKNLTLFFLLRPPGGKGLRW